MTRLKERPPEARPQHANQEGYGRASAWTMGTMGVFQELHANRGICPRGRESKVTHSWKEKREKEQGTRRKTRGAHHQAEKRAHKDAHRVQHMLLHACGKMSRRGWPQGGSQRAFKGAADAERKTREQGLLAHGQWLPCVRCVTCMRAGAAGETRWRTR